jgi:hypothetical protein
MTGAPFIASQVQRRTVLLLGAALSVSLLFAGAAVAQTGGDYDLSWSKITGGGGSSAGGSYLITSSIGQPLAGQVEGSGYVIDSGFWGGAAIEAFFKAWAPGLDRNP